MNLKRSFLFGALVLFAACQDGNIKYSGDKEDTLIAPAATTVPVKEEVISYGPDSGAYQGFIAYPEQYSRVSPVVLVVPEWWGLNDYVKTRARQLAALGYFAFAVDMYGKGQVAATPDEAKKHAMPFYSNPEMGLQRLKAAMQKLHNYPFADTSRIAAIGYCFGGSMVLNAAKAGMPLKGVVSFHGSLSGMAPQKDLKARILVCHGTADKNVPPEDVARFRKQLDSAGANYIFREYEGATHAFTNPDATATGKKFNMPIEYNATADSASWNEMKIFLADVLR
ncbi:MAG: dienelactone hydrolase family protein [Sphingobacteriales bacterium]|nr:MAG: dienelactone hydrolase family protein [Sphingobacteriales bacterium]